MLLSCSFSYSQETENPPAHPDQSSPASEAESSSQSQEAQKKDLSPKRKGRIPREKEAEGTQAPHRFDTNIPKSKYELNGQPLEVDPD